MVIHVFSPLRTDLLQEKYYGLHPYLYCAANPIRNIDPSGMTVVALQEDMQEAIKHTLRPEDAEFVSFDDNGVLNHELLKQCGSDSENLLALRVLSGSDINYDFSFATEFTDGTGTTYALKSKEDSKHTTGVTMTPGAPIEANPSYDNNVHIVVSDRIKTHVGKLETLSHEGYGHAYLFELKRSGINVNPFHEDIIVVEFYEDSGSEGKGMAIANKENNTILVNAITRAKNESVYNYQKHLQRKK